MQQQFLMKIVAIAILVFAEKNGLLGYKQFGFRGKMGCDTAVATFMYKVGTIHKDSAASIVCLDLSSAFFCVKHHNLENLFNKYISENSKPFFMKLLEQRKAVLYAKGKVTPEFNIPQVGTAQGEPTSPIFFILTMSGCLRYGLGKLENDVFVGSDATMFADDMQILNWAKDVDTLINKTFQVTERIMEYCANCGFKVNNQKSEIMTFGNYKIREQFPDPFPSPAGPIKHVKTLNMLGIRFNAKLEFTKQIEHIMNKLDWHTSNIHRLRNLGLKNHILKVLFSVCFGSFNFGLGLMPYWSKEKYSEAQVKLNRAIRRICDLKLIDGRQVSQRIMLRLVDILPFHLQHQRMALLLLNRVMRNQQPKELYDIIMSHLDVPEGWSEGGKPSEDHRLNGEAPLIKTNNSNTINANQTVLKRLFPVSCRDWFNKLPWDIRYRLGTRSFDNAILNHLQSMCFHRVTKRNENCSECRRKVDFNNVNIEDLIKNVQLEYKDENALSQKLNNQIISLETLLSCFLLKINDNEDVIVDGENWSDECSSSNDSELAF